MSRSRSSSQPSAEMPAKIYTSAVPFRSSRLAAPPSPFSPAEPITFAPLKRAYSATADIDLIKYLPPPTRQPMDWLWACHICHRQYNLSVTRRCLDDGHYFCAGTSIVRSRKDGTRKLRRHKACASEFDYAGWKDWGVWKRNLLTLTEQQKQRNSPCDSVFEDDDSEDESEEITTTASVVSPIDAGVPARTSSWQTAKRLTPIKDCWNHCDYPSECRWGKQFGVDTPVQSTFPNLDRRASVPNPNIPTDESTDFVDVDMNEAPLPTATIPKTHFSDILTPAQQQVVAQTLEGVDLEPPETSSLSSTRLLSDLADLVSRAQRRHSRSEIPASPLVEDVVQRPKVTRSSSRESLRRAVEGGFGVLAGFVGGWRSFSAPPTTARRKEEVGDGVSDGNVKMVDVDVELVNVEIAENDRGRGRGRRKSLG
ncbi:hypothetical protein QM012_005494 [Aureobasidium pullulans]|uniref:Uncharacterized protein n=1 Tax=Aureobasidium pullulans TaxID=5580 RepID=A0ABR0T4V4_AURPU